MVTLIVTQANDTVEEFEFAPTHSPISIGRRTGNDVAINCPSVSGQHARIVVDDDHARIEDLSSTNGTYINGRLISRQRLEHGDDVVIGRARITFLNEMTELLAPQDNPFLSEPTEVLAPPTADTQPAGDSADGDTDDASAEMSLRDGLEPYAERLAARHDADSARADDDDDQPRRRHQDHYDDDEYDVDHRDTDGADDDFGPDDGEPVVVRSRARQVERLSAVPGGPARAHPLHGLEAADEALVEDGRDVAGVDLGEAFIRIINGAKSGTTMPIEKAVTTLGRPGIQIAAIMRKPEGYFLMHVESDEHVGRPTINDREIGDEPVLLSSGDELQVAGVEVQFQLD